MNIRNHHKKQKSNATLYHGRDAIDQHLATQLHIKLYSPHCKLLFIDYLVNNHFLPIDRIINMLLDQYRF